jgi:hypothetical protein
MNTKLLFTTACCCCLLTGGCHKNNEEPSDTYDEGVEINGVVWATRNVGKPGTFAATREDPGMIYQWNSRVGWVCEDGEKKSSDGSEWLTIITPAATWSKTNDPCPNGWHIPTYDEAKKLEEYSDEIFDAKANEWENDVPIPTEIENRIQMMRELFIADVLRPGLVGMDAEGCDVTGRSFWLWEYTGCYWLAVSEFPPDTHHWTNWPILFLDSWLEDGSVEGASIVDGEYILYRHWYVVRTTNQPLPIRCVRD